ncbi:MAG TPA: sulfite exporter TauE/SafE family protein [Ktedonobacteraceae bacterium]|nr:sulfite exporter TauE/SafE family protein [Ktedonobacteraceae bacterium]
MGSLTLFQQILAVFSGALVGFTLGLIGGGGSILAVPLLLYVVGYHDTHVVIGTTALAVALTAYINLIPHWRIGNVRWLPAIAFAIPGVVGAALGAQIGKIVPGKQLLFLFALLMVGVAINMLRPSKSNAPRTVYTGKTMIARTTPVGFLVGTLSGFFGIGGGFLIVPGLMFATGMPLLNAIGTSLFSVGMFGTTTAITYAFSGLINWVIALEYIAGGVLGGLAGVRLATHLGKQKKTLSRIFAGVVLLVAVYMLYVNITALHL